MEGGLPWADGHVPPQLRHPREQERLGGPGQGGFEERETDSVQMRSTRCRSRLLWGGSVEPLWELPGTLFTLVGTWGGGRGGGVGYKMPKLTYKLREEFL